MTKYFGIKDGIKHSMLPFYHCYFCQGIFASKKTMAFHIIKYHQPNFGIDVVKHTTDLVKED